MTRDRMNPGGFFAGILFVVLGFVFLLEQLDVWRPDLDLFAPLALLALGVAIVLAAIYREEHTHGESK